MPRYKKLRPGDGFEEASAVDYNALIDLLIEHDADKKASLSGGSSADSKLPSGQVYVCNTTSALVEAFGVLGIKGSSWTPAQNLNSFQNQVSLDGDTPGSSYQGKFVIAAEAIPKGMTGRAVISGLARVQVTGSGSFADVKSGDTTQLQCGSSGAQILWADSGTSTRWAIVRIGGGGSGGTLLARATASAFTGSTSTVTISSVVPADGSSDSSTSANNLLNLSSSGSSSATVVMYKDSSSSPVWQIFGVTQVAITPLTHLNVSDPTVSTTGQPIRGMTDGSTTTPDTYTGKDCTS